MLIKRILTTLISVSVDVTLTLRCMRTYLLNKSLIKDKDRCFFCLFNQAPILFIFFALFLYKREETFSSADADQIVRFVFSNNEISRCQHRIPIIPKQPLFMFHTKGVVMKYEYVAIMMHEYLIFCTVYNVLYAFRSMK